MTKPLLVVNSQPPLLSPLEVAQRLKVSLRTVRRLIASRELEVIRIGGCVRVAESTLLAFVDGARQ